MTVVPGGPILVEGPVEIRLAGGVQGGGDQGDDAVRCERFQVAICACRRSKTYPLCDTSHRRRR